MNEPRDFEPRAFASDPRAIYYPKIKLQNDHPETITRATMIRTSDYKLVRRPDGQDEFYDLRKDPRELHNVIGDRQYATRQEELSQRMLDWYIRTADVAPKKHDPRGSPKFPA